MIRLTGRGLEVADFLLRLLQEVICMLSTPILTMADIDALKVDPMHHQVVFENDQVRVVRWFVAPGDTTLNHSHPNNLNICLTDYDGRVTIPNEKAFAHHADAGAVAWREPGTHAVENVSGHPMEGIIIEPKQPASTRPAGSSDPVAIDPEHHKVEFENERIRVLRERRDPGTLPMHGHPDCVQVLLTDLNIAVTTADGRTETTMGKAGEVRWRPAVEHTGVVLGDRPVEQILVEMKNMDVKNPSH